MSTAAAPRIVVIEDEEDILAVLDYNLAREGFDVTVARDGAQGLAAIRGQVPDLVVLDLMLPEVDGIEVCRQIKGDVLTAHVPVIMLTAKGGEADIVLGLGVGADDYVTKPFSPRELVARVQAVMRRSVAQRERATAGGAATGHTARDDAAGGRVEAQGLVVDPARHKVLVNGATVRFTPTELNLLHFLASNPGRVFTREHIVARVIGDNAWVIDRTIDVHVRAVRRKLGQRAYLVETIRGVGYRFRDERA